MASAFKLRPNKARRSHVARAGTRKEALRDRIEGAWGVVSVKGIIGECRTCGNLGDGGVRITATVGSRSCCFLSCTSPGPACSAGEALTSMRGERPSMGCEVDFELKQES